jgi:hypothetical protein
MENQLEIRPEFVFILLQQGMRLQRQSSARGARGASQLYVDQSLEGEQGVIEKLVAEAWLGAQNFFPSSCQSASHCVGTCQENHPYRHYA